MKEAATKYSNNYRGEQHIALWPVDHRRSNIGNEKLPDIYWKWKHNVSQPMGQRKDSPMRKFYGHECLYL
jgi:hypothetical protein